eukprot:scaffold3083_cov440-Prasinococcus_capsulatus_cf.AAC.2
MGVGGASTADHFVPTCGGARWRGGFACAERQRSLWSVRPSAHAAGHTSRKKNTHIRTCA